jgi:hypothetical protein
MNMETNIIGHDKEDCGVEVFDERGNRHAVTLSWDGTVWEHGTDDYPHKREDRTQEEQRIMSQVEARAKYAAQQEFPDKDILDPMWDPEHLEAGLEALANYDLTEFHTEFRDFYDALNDPSEFIPHDDFELGNIAVFKVFRFQKKRIVDVAPVMIRHHINDTEAENFGELPDYPEDEQIVCSIPALDFDDDFEYEDDFQDIVVSHIMAQIRDLYLNMGETPPDRYLVEGIGKHDIHGDGIGDS